MQTFSVSKSLQKYYKTKQTGTGSAPETALLLKEMQQKK